MQSVFDITADTVINLFENFVFKKENTETTEDTAANVFQRLQGSWVNSLNQPFVVIGHKIHSKNIVSDINLDGEFFDVYGYKLKINSDDYIWRKGKETVQWVPVEVTCNLSFFRITSFRGVFETNKG